MVDLNFPAVLDATMFKAYKRCPRNFFHAHIEGKRLGDLSIDLIAGGAFAKGMEVARSCFYTAHGMAETAIGDGVAAMLQAYGPDRPAEKKNHTRLEEAFRAYFRKWPLSNTKGIVPDNLGIESSFSFPIVGLVHPDTQEPLCYAGRRDAIGTESIADDPISGDASERWGIDEKTGGYIKEGFAYDYELDWQFLGYMYHERFVLGNHIDGFAIRKIGLTRKEFDPKLDLAEGRITFSDQVLEDWYVEMLNTADLIMADYENYKNGKFPFSQVFGNACNEYKGCDFKSLCRHTTPPEYKIVHWNPLTREEE